MVSQVGNLAKIQEKIPYDLGSPWKILPRLQPSFSTWDCVLKLVNGTLILGREGGGGGGGESGLKCCEVTSSTS